MGIMYLCFSAHYVVCRRIYKIELIKKWVVFSEKMHETFLINAVFSIIRFLIFNYAERNFPFMMYFQNLMRLCEAFLMEKVV